jgi:hypothetical protein
VIHYSTFLEERYLFSIISYLKNSRLSNQVCRLPVEPVLPVKKGNGSIFLTGERANGKRAQPNDLYAFLS